MGSRTNRLARLLPARAASTAGALTVAALFAAVPTLAADWLRFRGPNGSGAAPDTTLPVAFSAATATWAREVPFGQSSPIVARGTVFLTALDGEGLATLAFDARSGQEKWRRSVPRLRQDVVA